ncbi:MAG: DMT family transporter [Candidatus Eisenbacteria bacterium]
MTPERRAPIVVAFAIVVVSFAAILIRLCNVPTAVIAAFRLAFSSLILLPLFAGKRRGLVVTKKQVGLCALSGVFLSLHFLLWIESLQITTVASSVVLVTTSPIFAAIFAWVVLREGISRRTLVATVLCFLGSLSIGRGDIHLGPGMLKGDLFALGGAAAFGACFVIGRSLRRSLGYIEYAFMTYTASAVLLLAWMMLRGHGFTGFEPVNYLWFALLALGPQVFGHTSLNWALKYIPAPKVAISILGEPVGSALLAWLFFAEVPGYALFIGGALILYGVYLAMTD